MGKTKKEQDSVNSDPPPSEIVEREYDETDTRSDDEGGGKRESR